MVACQDKEEKERQMNSRAAVEETAEERANFNSIGVEEEIIELQVGVLFTYYASYIIMHHITYHMFQVRKQYKNAFSKKKRVIESFLRYHKLD